IEANLHASLSPVHGMQAGRINRQRNVQQPWLERTPGTEAELHLAGEAEQCLGARRRAAANHVEWPEGAEQQLDEVLLHGGIAQGVDDAQERISCAGLGAYEAGHAEVRADVRNEEQTVVRASGLLRHGRGRQAPQLDWRGAGGRLQRQPAALEVDRSIAEEVALLEQARG